MEKRSQYQKKPSDKATIAEVQALIVAAVKPAVVGTRLALIAASVALVLSVVALIVAVVT